MRYIITNYRLLGILGEHLAGELVFPEVCAWAREFGPGQAQMLYQPPGLKTSYPVILEQAEDG